MHPLSSRRVSNLRLLATVLLSSQLPSAFAGYILYGHSNAVPNILELDPEQTCLMSVDGITSTSFPWTHNPTCIGQFCVYSSSRFANNRGISLIATPETATSYLLESYSREDQLDRDASKLPYEARDTKGRGIGLFAKGKIGAGETLMVKHPVILMPKELADGDRDTTEQRLRLLEIAVRQLPRDTTNLLMDLSTNMGGLRLDDLFRTNAKGLSLQGGEGYLGVVPEAARINHACRPNAFYRFNDYTLTLEVFTLRNITKGEELTFSYGYSTNPHPIRQDRIRKEWGFTCTCPLCTSPSKTLSASDARLTDIAEIKRILPVGHESIPQLIALLPNLISLMDEEDLITEVPMYAEILAYSWSALGIEERAKKWGTRAWEMWRILAGKESWEAKRTSEFVENVKGHPSWATWDQDPWDDSQWEEDDHHDHDHDHNHDHDHSH